MPHGNTMFVGSMPSTAFVLNQALSKAFYIHCFSLTRFHKWILNKKETVLVLELHVCSATSRQAGMLSSDEEEAHYVQNSN